MFGRCRGPVWHGDDFTRCFQTDLSLSILAANLVRHITQKYDEQRARHPTLVDVSDGPETTDDVDNLSDLTLQKTFSHAVQPILDLDKPTGEISLVVLELVALCAQVSISVVYLLCLSTPHSHRILVSTISVIATWSYLMLLVAIRLYLSVAQPPLPNFQLWNHTFFLYGAQWLLKAIVFRSVLIHPISKLDQRLTTAEFATTTLLALIALLSRKGNRIVKLEYEGDIEPSREPLASVMSLLSFAWVDRIVWKGFRRPLELADVWNVTLKDKAEVVLQNFRQVKKTHMLAIRLLLFFRKPLLIQGAYCMVASVFMFLPTILLKAILEYLEQPDRVPKNAAWLYVILLLATGFVQAITDGQSLWIGRKICIRLRGIIIGEIYSKLLRRRAAAFAEKENPTEQSMGSSSIWQKLVSKLTSKSINNTTGENNQIKLAGTQMTNGAIINLMSIDSFKVSEISGYLHFLWASVPVQLVVAVVLLHKVLGHSSFAGIVLMIMVLPLNMFIAKSFQRAQKRIMTATDSRIHATNEVLSNIRIIKYFAWERRFAANVNEKRQMELDALWRKYILWSSAATVWSGIPILITFASFFIYTVVEKRQLTPSIAFPSLSMFSLLRVPLDQLADMVAHVQESKVSIDRVEQFLREEETEKYAQMKQSKQASPHETRIALQNATLAWGTEDQQVSANTASGFRLINVNVEFTVGKLNVIAGPTGSGKTSLLMALLGEMNLVKGSVLIPGGHSRQDLRPDPRSGLTESVAYCAQQAWLVNATIKENILFSLPEDCGRYNAVIAACALARDLEILDAGDQTLVGEKGITLSGGQKQRISLARALYSNSKHILLDDCLSAVDSHTAKHIFDNALNGGLMLNRTCILVSHNVALTVPFAATVIVLANGKVIAQGPPEVVIKSGHLGEEMQRSRPASVVPSAAPSPPRRHSFGGGLSDDVNGHANGHLQKAAKSDKKFTDTRIEGKATGSVNIRTIGKYLRSMGPWWYWIFAGLGFIAVQLGSIATNLWIRQWANAYSIRQDRYAVQHGVQTTMPTHVHPLSGGSLFQLPIWASNLATATDGGTKDDVDAGYYLGVYALIGLAYIVICFVREIVLFWGSLRASWVLHERLLQSVLRATFRFFDSTPLGQMTNRFSKDVQAIDQEVAPVAIGMLHSAAAVVTIIILISAITPGFLLPGFFIACTYVATGLFYVRSSRDLKRIESVNRSPLFQHFGETLSGVVTIRAYGEEARFVQDNHHRVNTHNRPFIYLWATNRWLAFRIDVSGAFVSFFSATFVVINAGKIDAGAAGLALSYAITFTQNVLWLVRLYASNEQNMNAVERVQEYIDVDQEAAAIVPAQRPASDWPKHGTVQFVDYSTRYRRDLEPVLRHLSFTIAAGEKVGIVGRTGAGKSSLALALFRGLEAEQGKIMIDDVQIGLIGLQDLREAITIVPQDPTLFSGTLRSNLDPFELFTDEEIFTALRRVQLVSASYSTSSSSSSLPQPPAAAPTAMMSEDAAPEVAVDTQPHVVPEQPSSTVATWSSTTPTLVRHETNTFKDNQNVFNDLSSPIAESGSNLSQGQRQLLCLARALLKAPKVLVMDEATASIDYATDSKIQETLRELRGNTIITIAHRLQTIIDYDKVLVLDKGEVVEYADPWELIQKADGVFKAMCETTGDMEILVALAKKAWESRRLVDDT